MRTKTSRTQRVLLKSGLYRVRVGRWATVETPFNTCVEFRFNLRDKGMKRYSIEASMNAELIGGEHPSELYSWISALVFDGKALPEGYTLRTASLLLREAWAAIVLIDNNGLLFNRIVRLYPLRDAEDGDVMPAQADHPGSPVEDKQWIQSQRRQQLWVL